MESKPQAARHDVPHAVPYAAAREHGRLLPTNRALIALALLGLAGGSAWLASRWWFRHTHESTDDAQLDGHVIPIISRAGGYVARVAVSDNQLVRAGDTLVVIDPSDVRVRLARARAAEEMAASDAGAASTAAIREAEAQVAVAAARLDGAGAARARQAQEHARVRDLAAAHIASNAQLEDAEAADRQAEAAHRAASDAARAARASVAKLQGQRAAASARLASARADVAEAELQLGYTVITAPADGRVAKRAVERGQLVASGQALMALVESDSVWITANFKETQLGRLRIGAPVTFTVDAFGDREFRGVLTSVQPATGARFALLPPDNATGNFTKVVQRVPAQIVIDRVTARGLLLEPGLSATVDVDVRGSSGAGRASAAASP